MTKKSLYTIHREAWLGCTRCELHRHRKTVVLCRGQLPCDVLFVGEAPGESENVLGQPFVGPAGQLLDKIITKVIRPWLEDPKKTVDGNDHSLRWAFTNLVACIPHNEDGNKYEVPKESIKACQPRLVGLAKIAKPKLVVQVGTLSEKHWKAKDWEAHVSPTDVPRFVKIDHPAFILRNDVSNRGLLIQKCEAVLEDAFLETFGSYPGS